MSPILNSIFHYEVLGIPPAATELVIRTAYMALAKKHHPDINGAKHVVRFSEITASYAVLKDRKARKLYDAQFRMLNKMCPKCDGAGQVRVQAGFGNVSSKQCGMCCGTGRR